MKDLGRPKALLHMIVRLTASASCCLAGQASAQEQPAPVEAPAAPEQNIDINEYIVEGNTVLDMRAIERAVMPYLGPQRPLGDIERARAALEQIYTARGYQTVFVEVPRQEVSSDGIIRLQVVESRIGAVTVAGAEHRSPEWIRRQLPSLREEQVPDIVALNHELVALNAGSGDVQVTPDIRPAAAPGQIDVALNVEDRSSWHGSVGVNNQNSRDTSQLRASVALRYENLWGRGHEIGGFYSTAPRNRKDAEVFALSYAEPLSPRTRIELSALHSNSDVATVADTNVIGRGTAVTLALSHDLSDLGAPFAQSLEASVAYKDFEERVRFGAETDLVPITYLPVRLGWNGVKREEDSDLTLSAALTFAFRGLGSDLDAFDAKRYQATGGFAYLSLNASYRHDLPLGLEVFGLIDGQLANEALVSNEQFSLGGSGTVRGYLQSEAIGDNGFFESVELRSPDLAPKIGTLFDELRGYVFADLGRVWLIDALPGQSGDALAGVGAGLRFRAIRQLSGQVDFGVPLIDAGTARAGDPRVHFRIGADF